MAHFGFLRLPPSRVAELITNTPLNYLPTRSIVTWRRVARGADRGATAAHERDAGLVRAAAVRKTNAQDEAPDHDGRQKRAGGVPARPGGIPIEIAVAAVFLQVDDEE